MKIGFIGIFTKTLNNFLTIYNYENRKQQQHFICRSKDL